MQTDTDIDAILRTEVPAAYRAAIAAAGFPMNELRALTKLRQRRAVLDLATALGSIALGPLLYAAFPNPVTFVFVFFFSIRTFNCFAQLVHMSDHGALFVSPWANRVGGNIAASCLGYTRTGHRLAHLNHHLYLNTVRDPDRIWGAPDETTRELRRQWLKDLFFLSAFERLLQYSQSDHKTVSVSPWKKITVPFLVRTFTRMSPVFVAQGVILGVYWVTVGPVYYVLLWVLPILTFYPAQIRLRSTVEHSFDAGYQATAPEDYWVTRSTAATFLERFVFAPLAIDYHFEHHLFPVVPHYNLHRVRELLVRAGIAVPIVPGYVSFVIQKMRQEKVPACRAA
jgi:fatty acid desaturase